MSYPCLLGAAKPLDNLKNVASLDDIWNGRRMRELRTNIREDKLEFGRRLYRRQLPLCRLQA